MGLCFTCKLPLALYTTTSFINTTEIDWPPRRNSLREEIKDLPFDLWPLIAISLLQLGTYWFAASRHGKLSKQANKRSTTSYLLDEEYCAKVKNPKQEDLEGLIFWL